MDTRTTTVVLPAQKHCCICVISSWKTNQVPLSQSVHIMTFLNVALIELLGQNSKVFTQCVVTQNGLLLGNAVGVSLLYSVIFNNQFVSCTRHFSSPVSPSQSKGSAFCMFIKCIVSSCLRNAYKITLHSCFFF